LNPSVSSVLTDEDKAITLIVVKKVKFKAITMKTADPDSREL
jgi:hypothetical protein